MIASIPELQYASNFFLNRILIRSGCSQTFALFHAFKGTITNLYITIWSCILILIPDHDALGFIDTYFYRPRYIPHFRYLQLFNIPLSSSFFHLHPILPSSLINLPSVKLSFCYCAHFYLYPELHSSYFTISISNHTFCCQLNALVPHSYVSLCPCYLPTLSPFLSLTAPSVIFMLS
jgi:hypothetical protein